MRLSLLYSALAFFTLAAGPAFAALTPFSEDFEALDPMNPTALGDTGWLVGANVYEADGTTFIYNYFAFPAPNGGPAFSGIATGESGAAQGVNVLNTYNDYNNTDHAMNPDRRIEANIFRDIGIIAADDVGKTYDFSFDVKQGNIGGTTTATAFVKVLDQPSFALEGIDFVDTTATGTNWATDTASITIDAAWVGSLVQIGFTNTANGFGDAGVFYDNISFAESAVAIPEPGSLTALALGSVAVITRRRRRR
tara:strand:+ start:936718 stop:937473 length:756 start_codon:yes stop_codon:yes gene_type:complete